MAQKKKIYYARTYRRLKLDLKINILFSCLMIIPALIALVMSIDEITYGLSKLAYTLLSEVIPQKSINIATTEYAGLNTLHYLKVPTTYPQTSMIIGNLVVCAVIFLITKIFKVTGRPLAIYFNFTIFIQVINCVYFLFAAKYFPYTTSEYSYMYMLQQVGIWLVFIILAGLVIGFVGEGNYIRKMCTFITIMIYSAIFGAVRYIVYLYILYEFSVLYMALFFFVIGPMFDFSYFVAIYARFINKTIKEYDYGKKRGEWEWS